ncbi:hypothetical protein P9250_05465 [Caballeronia sp. LP006]|jgi:hypothetical protein|uniref:hypothetical protein n=1 Tax=unclassified Caballeronia TaxID=2646786 RepID=UPI001FD46F59|nr:MULTISPECIES: hypothetical protein [unclassified Caballeronia]MDR5773747.1 hypothetical protein [Caballeronia sp. LZ002]MDR5799470.1 hypothetical protein [Caballeronia sp. LZ001]MDR5827312.1 hypothetical protein [Caballeronia sp. LP006]MDR5849182.1 hypothetical protein [Caballeronia sp. LZ003]
MKIEPTPIAGASLVDIDIGRDAPVIDTAPTLPDTQATAMSYEALLPYLLLPIAGAY